MPAPAKSVCRECRKKQKDLKNLSDSILIFLHFLDQIGNTIDDQEVGSKIAKLATALDMANDRARFFALGVDYRRDDKAKAVAKLLGNPDRSLWTVADYLRESGMISG